MSQFSVRLKLVHSQLVLEGEKTACRLSGGCAHSRECTQQGFAEKWYGKKQDDTGDLKVQRHSVSHMYVLEQTWVESNMLWGGRGRGIESENGDAVRAWKCS